MTTDTALATSQHPNDKDKSGRRRPFSTWMKKLTNFKGHSSTADITNGTNRKERRNTYQPKSKDKKVGNPSRNNNPYPESGHLNSSAAQTNRHQSVSSVPTGSVSVSSLGRGRNSINISESGGPPTIGNKSTAAASTDAAQSHVASSEKGNTTVGGGVSSARGADSTFSSPAPSIRSLTTTLTTIHSATLNNATSATTTNGTATSTIPHSVQFSHQFPASPPPSALPAHLVPNASGGHPSTYNTATANNLLTDNASILTLASSSKRRRRRSMDTDASVRALAPSSLFGGSRESLPLSVLSATVDSSTPTTQMQRPVGGLCERASIYSSTGIAPALPSERNSYYAKAAADGGSVKSGLPGHARNDSVSGSIGGPTPSNWTFARRFFGGLGGSRRHEHGWGWDGCEQTLMIPTNNALSPSHPVSVF
ncbi:hypothetical protein BJ878DRAFT_534803 [Calycina marina]|uniref:Uncharacterized protein n=1 Tax=Calycina marina TaxID=1763456 RepID=A0A9P8CEG4_9HELO|nr:hypothetical protein BJ878DRAFT_534803 [Calycina marina]